MKRLLLIGGGLSSCVLGRIAKDNGWYVEIHEKEKNIGGMLVDVYDAGYKMRYSKFGAHCWHFSNKTKEAENFIKKYGKFVSYNHKVLAFSNNSAFVMWPISLPYLKLFKEMHPRKKIFKEFVENYSKKMWKNNYKEVIKNIKARFKFKNSFNTDFFENERGYVCLNYKELFKNLTRDIRVIVNKEDNIDTIHNELDNFDYIIVSTPVNKFFKDIFGKLEFVGLDFKILKLKCNSNIFPTSVVNTNSHSKIIRMVEYNQLFMNQKNNNKIIGIEIPSAVNNLSYPVITKRNLNILKKYTNYCLHFNNLIFHGRLGNFQYENMDNCVQNSINLYKKLMKGGKNGKR